MSREGQADVNVFSREKPAQPSVPYRTVALKFCGGCNPTFDRLLYWERIKEETAEAIRWVNPDHPHPDGLLLICGCQASCPLKFFTPEDYALFLLVNDPADPPESVTEKLSA